MLFVGQADVKGRFRTLLIVTLAKHVRMNKLPRPFSIPKTILLLAKFGR